ncbi:MAG: RsmD family RNA methyltransferase [Methanoregula sp.]|jgi:tRNA (guanine37-N1)-methyltransferase|nr:RsmD family RNA methyltransferase [Methanoregula sp.]
MRLKDLLKGTVPEDALARFSGHFDVIGNVAIVSIPPELEEYKKTIAETILSGRRNIYTVLNKVHKVRSEARTASYEILAGDTTMTRYREFGFQYRFDVMKVFFNIHLAYERMRVTDQVEPGEQVLVPFCGVGPFAIPAAARGAHVVAVEQNPDAYTWLQENIALNHVRNTITAIRGDARDTALLPKRRFDRIIIPTPYGMDFILDVLAQFAIREGMIHFYTFKAKNEIPALVDEFAGKGFDLTYQNTCGNVAPGISRWVFDLVKKG